jgi:SNF2 family DNA or RNA helicase
VGSKERQSAEEAIQRLKTFIPDNLLSQLPGQSYIRQTNIMVSSSMFKIVIGLCHLTLLKPVSRQDDHFSLCGKMSVIDSLLRAIKIQQGRLLLFSTSTQMMDLIENYLVAKGHSYLRMDGTTSAKKREELISEFKKNSDIFLFLLSTKAMGLGLNLTEANFVIIFDVDWNPSNDAQAQDRVYRIGQKKNVTVFRLVTRGTLDELKYLRQVYKTELKSETIVKAVDADRASAERIFRGVAGDKDRKGELFGLANLLKFKDGTFMNYGSKESESHKYGLGIYDSKNFLEGLRHLSETAELEFDEIIDSATANSRKSDVEQGEDYRSLPFLVIK